MQAVDTQTDRTVKTVQQFGALATRLNDALGRARVTLAAHTSVLPDGTLAEIDALHAEFERRRVRIAIYGEVKAGKSTLVNALAGAELSPVGFEPLTSVPVRITYGDATAWRIGDRLLTSVADLEHAMRHGLNGTREVVVETALDLLQLGGQVDLLDTPGVGSAEQFDAISASALRSLDAVVVVVRYPALFTQFTRRLMGNLRADIGKLFVVWNLDADCAELTPEERQRHAETLRTNIAGAHELFAVDARAGQRAMQANDAAGSVASGLTALIAALTRFVSSGGREIAALREAAKRADQRLGDAHRSLAERHAVLDSALAGARGRLQAVQDTADSESAVARARFAELGTVLTRAGQHATAKGAQLAADLRRELRRARRRWSRRGHAGALEAAVAAATNRYADATEAANQATAETIRGAVTQFGAEVTLESRGHTVPAHAPLAPDDRSARATRGRWQWLRRTVWHKWYLPGLAALDGAGINADLRTQAAWVSSILQIARGAADATLATQLADVTRRAEAAMQNIKVETDFVACTAEYEQLAQDIPVVSAQHEAITSISAEARALL